MKPAPPVTTTVVIDAASTASVVSLQPQASAGLLPAERSEQVGKRADPRQGERDVEPAIFGHGGRHQRSLKVERLIFDGHAAALCIVIRHPALVEEAIALDVVVERVGAPDAIAEPADVDDPVDVLI